MKKRYICLNCGRELDNLAGLAVPCPICGVLMPDHWTVCDFCEAEIRGKVEEVLRLHKPKNRKAAADAYAAIVRRMAGEVE